MHLVSVSTRLATEVDRVDQLHKKVKTLYEVVDQHAELKEAYSALAEQVSKVDMAEKSTEESQHIETSSLVQKVLKHAPVSWLQSMLTNNKQEADSELEEPSINVTK